MLANLSDDQSPWDDFFRAAYQFMQQPNNIILKELMDSINRNFMRYRLKQLNRLQAWKSFDQFKQIYYFIDGKFVVLNV